MTKCEKQCELLKPFNDEYFKGLSYSTIAELAKKSIRLTAENRELEGGLEDMNEQIAELTTKLDFTTRQYEALQKKYAEVLRLAKENADSYEYCMKTLEEEIRRLRND